MEKEIRKFGKFELVEVELNHWKFSGCCKSELSDLVFSLFHEINWELSDHYYQELQIGDSLGVSQF